MASETKEGDLPARTANPGSTNSSNGRTDRDYDTDTGVIRHANNMAQQPRLVSSKALPLPDGCYHIFASHSGKVVDIPGGRRDNALGIEQFQFHGGKNQAFYLRATPDGYYFVECLCNGLVWDIEGASAKQCAKLIQFPKHGGANQQFRIDDIGGNKFRIIAKHSSMALDVSGAKQENKASIIQFAYHGANNQLFMILPTSA